MRAAIACVAGASLILTSTSCSHLVHRPFDREVTEHMDVEKPWIELQGWTDASGGTHQRKGYACVTADSVLIYDQEPGREAEQRPALSMHRSEVTQVQVRRFSLIKTSMVVVLPLAVLIGAAAATKENSIGD